MIHKNTEARFFLFCFVCFLEEHKYLLWFFCDILVLFLFAIKTAALLLWTSFGLDYRVNGVIRTRTGVQTQRSVSCWHMLDCLFWPVFASTFSLVTCQSGCMTWFQPLSVFMTSFFFLIAQHQQGEPLLKPPYFSKQLAILCTFLSLRETWRSLGSCTVGRMLWRWSHSNLFFHQIARILYTTVLGCLSIAICFSTHKRCRRKTALKHIRWSVAVVFGEPAVTLYGVQMYGRAPFLLVSFM